LITAKNYIDGNFEETREFTNIVSPLDGEVIGNVPQSGEAEIESAVTAAEAAFPSWSDLAPAARGAYLQKAASLIEQHAEQLALIAMKEMGKPLAEMKGEVMRGVNILRYYAVEGWHANGDVIPASDAKTFQYTTKVPVGPVALITPWNFPVAIPLWKIAPALIYGNTIVWKAAEQSSLSGYELMKLLAEAGFPKGVINYVSGRGSKLGPLLVEAAAIQAVSFTGSDVVGRDVAVRATKRGIKFQTEMGGKNALIVADDADLDLTVDVTISGAMRSAGQKCTATSRVIVDATVYEEFKQKLVDKVQALRVGQPHDPATYVGPVSSHRQRDSIMDFIQKGTAEGATVLIGGRAPDDETLSKGAYVLPTIFDGVHRTMTIAQEEIFGPVIALLKADDFNDAIDILNDSRYGLSASIFTKSLQKAFEFVKRAEVGMVRVNAETAGVELHAPFGGMKGSSSHTREQGRAAMEFYTHTKTVSITT